MKKFNITSEKLAIIVFTTIQILCAFIAAAFALEQHFTNYDLFGAIGYLSLIVLCEWVKWKISHQNDEEKQDNEY